MELKQACWNILSQLKYVVSNITDDDFSKPLEVLGKSTIGQHLRHTLEFFLCLQQGHASGVINYDKRAHDRFIESHRSIALDAISSIRGFVDSLSTNKPIRLEVGYDIKGDHYVTIESNTDRELAYNIEHAVHHMAIMKIGIREVAPYINLPDDFGIAASTIRFQQKELKKLHV